MNPPAKSKINWTALGIQLITIAVLLDWIPAEFSDVAIAIAGIVLPSLVQTFRTWFTGKQNSGPPTSGENM